MSAIQDSVCQKLDLAFTGFLSSVQFAYTAVSGTINTVKTFINGMVYSATDALQQASNDIMNGLDDAIPNFPEEANELQRLINACQFLKNDKTLNNLLTMTRSLKGSIRQGCQNVIDGVVTSLQEYTAAELLDGLFVRYADEFKFEEIIPNMYTIIDCIDALCPNTDISSKVLSFENYVNKLYLLTNGRFDRVTFFDELGLSDAQKGKMDIVLASYQNMRQQLDDAISTGVDYAKSLL